MRGTSIVLWLLSSRAAPCDAFRALHSPGQAVSGACAVAPFIVRAPRAVIVLSEVTVTSHSVIVQRSEAGGLGIDVDDQNTIAGNAGQPDLMVGDVITAVDGEEVGGRHVSQVLTPGAQSYTFIVRRDAAEAVASLQRVLIGLTAQAAAGTAGLEGKALELIGALEEAADPTPPEELRQQLLGFWRVRYTSGDEGRFASAGLSGFGSAPFCQLVGHFQCFSEPQPPSSPSAAPAPSAQTVEVIANTNLGSSQLATLKGNFDAAPGASGEGGGAVVRETYERIEYGGTPQLGEVVEQEWRCAFVGELLRVCKAADGSIRLYERLEAQDAQEAIGRLLSARVAPSLDDMPRWQRADLERGQSTYEGPAQSAGIP